MTTMPMISQRSIDRIIEFEVSSRAYYEKNYQHPEWPGGFSGVTIGIGYDLGYASVEKIIADWSGLVTPDILSAMKRCSGVHGDDARRLLPLVKQSIVIPWDSATKVFLERDVPQWTSAVCAKVPTASQLPPDCLGALVSLAYNRGASFDAPGDRYAEMRALKDHTNSRKWVIDPTDFRAMKRLWPNAKGLRDRRDVEAKLFEDGLRNPSVQAPTSHTATEKPEKTMPPPPAGNVEHGSAGGAGTAAGGTITQSVPADHIWQWWEIALAAGGVIAVIVIVWLAVRWYRKGLPTLAREKDHPVAAPAAA